MTNTPQRPRYRPRKPHICGGWRSRSQVQRLLPPWLENLADDVPSRAGRYWTVPRWARTRSGPLSARSAHCMAIRRRSTSPVRTATTELARGLHRSGRRRADRLRCAGHHQRRPPDAAHRGELPATPLAAAVVPAGGRQARRHPLCEVLHWRRVLNGADTSEGEVRVSCSRREAAAQDPAALIGHPHRLKLALPQQARQRARVELVGLRPGAADAGVVRADHDHPVHVRLEDPRDLPTAAPSPPTPPDPWAASSSASVLDPLRRAGRPPRQPSDTVLADRDHAEIAVHIQPDRTTNPSRQSQLAPPQLG